VEYRERGVNGKAYYARTLKKKKQSKNVIDDDYLFTDD
jgi:hypothetical protein